MQFRVLTAVLAVTQAVNLQREREEDLTNPFHFPKGTDDIIDFLDEEVGNLKWTPPAEYETFEASLNGLLDDFYGKAGNAFGDRVYGDFYEHGGYSDVDGDLGLDPHGLPVYQHQHFDYNGQYGNHYADEFKPHYIDVNYPDEQAYSYQVEPTIQYTRLEHKIPHEYSKPVPNFNHVDPEGYFNEWEDFYIEDYLGSPGFDHSHFDYQSDVEFHNHHLADPYAIERKYQPPVDEYFIPVVVSPIPTARYPEVVIIEEELIGGDYPIDIPLDLSYYLADDYDVHHPYEEIEYIPEPVYYEPRPYVQPYVQPYLAPVYDDLDFLFEHQNFGLNHSGYGHQKPAYHAPEPIYYGSEPRHGPSHHAPSYETIHHDDRYNPTVGDYLADPYVY